MNKYQMLKYDDVRDRVLIREWFKLKGVVLEHGSKYGVDLEGKDYDVEISHLSFDRLWNQWKKENELKRAYAVKQDDVAERLQQIADEASSYHSRLIYLPNSLRAQADKLTKYQEIKRGQNYA